MSIPLYRPHKYVIHPLLIGKQIMPKAWFTYKLNYLEAISMANGIFYIAGTGKHVLVDTAGKAETALKFAGGLFAMGAEDFATPVEALKKVDITPADVDMVIMTHLHWDHAEYIKEFKNAKIVVQKDELDYANDPGPLFKGTYWKELWEGAALMVVDGDVELFPGIWVLLTPGHSAGGQSVLVDTEKGRVIICGLCAINDNFNPPKALTAWQVVAPGNHIDAQQAYDSMLRIKTMADIVVTIHDPKTFERETIP